MKKAIILAVALTLVMGGIAFAKVASSKHDLSTVVTDNAGTQVCVYCHHPHKGEVGYGQNALLWNINDATADYPVYKPTDTMTYQTDQGNATKPQTLLCMGCHDGDATANTFVTRSVEGNFEGLMSAQGFTLANPAANLGTSLEGDHPVGFTYPTASMANKGDVKMASNGMVESLNGTYPLFNGTMECATCHDVHAGNPNGLDSKDDFVQFMRGSLDQSQICTDCHETK